MDNGTQQNGQPQTMVDNTIDNALSMQVDALQLELKQREERIKALQNDKDWLQVEFTKVNDEHIKTIEHNIELLQVEFTKLNDKLNDFCSQNLTNIGGKG